MRNHNKNTYTQLELLNIMQRYNSTDRLIIKTNLQETKKTYNFGNADIVNDLGYKEEKIKGWYNKANKTIQVFEDALRLAVHYGFDITELME